MASRPKAYISWSSGKDSAYALYVPRQQGEVEIAGLLTTLTEDYGRVGENGEFHTVATHGPMFSSGIGTVSGEVVERDGFIFADVLPA